MKILSAELASSAVSADQVARLTDLQIALVGRSNVGKSSLINALIRRKLARTSRAPGKTDLINLYRVRVGLTATRTETLCLVDLPGYGYARGGTTRAQVFAARASEYFDALEGQRAARGPTPLPVLLLVDARHPGLDADRGALAWLVSRGLRVLAVGTKADTLARAERQRAQRALDEQTGSPVLLVSAKNGDGLKELWRLILDVAV